MTKITHVQGDITKQIIDALVNASNKSLLVGGGVDGAIHKAAGFKLKIACARLGGCHTGEAKITEGFNLPARFVIHTVGPVYGREEGREEELLANCYRYSLAVAMANGIRTIAFPSIATGVHGYPIEDAARLAISTVKNVVAENPGVFDEIRFVTFSDADAEVYERLLQ